MAGLPINALRGGAERTDLRREERFLAERPIHMVYQGQPMDAWLVDCSAHGLQIVSKQIIESQEEFQVEVRLHGKFRLVRYQVRYWFQLWADACQIGAQLVEEIPETEANMILQDLLAGAKHNRSVNG